MNENMPSEANNGHQDIVELGASAASMALHRVGAVRSAKGLSHHELARRLGTTVEKVRLQEEAADLSISTLTAWAAALGVSITDLVVEPEEWLQETQLAKPQAERLLQLAARLRDQSRRRSIQRLAQTFVDQLKEIQPELAAAAGGNGNGRRHRKLLSNPKANGNGTNGKHAQSTNGKNGQPPNS